MFIFENEFFHLYVSGLSRSIQVNVNDLVPEDFMTTVLACNDAVTDHVHNSAPSKGYISTISERLVVSRSPRTSSTRSRNLRKSRGAPTD